MTAPAPLVALVPPPPPARPRRRWVVLGAALAAVAAAALVAVLVSPGGGQKRAPVGTGVTVPARPTEGAGSGVGAPDVAVPTQAPAGITWTSFLGVVLPYSATAGPSRVNGPVVAGYADTPTGALVAGLQLLFRVGFTPPPGLRTVVLAQVMPGPARDLYQTLRGQYASEPPPGSFDQVAGFRFDGYSPDLAVITYAEADPGGGYHTAPVTLAWSGGDWRLVLPAGLVYPPAARLADLTGYVPWSGVS